MSNEKPLIKIIKNGPYLVTGGLPLHEEIITRGREGYVMKQGRSYNAPAVYSICRCGKSKNMPFCDGSHVKARFNGKELADKSVFMDNAEVIEGPSLTLYDNEKLCAFARFCHRPEGDVWELTQSADPRLRDEAIKAACECPAGRLVMVDNATGEAIEPDYEPSLVIIQDPERDVSGPLWVRGGVPVELSDGTTYEVRNRVTLCRCGKSKNMPFCDATHVMTGFSDE